METIWAVVFFVFGTIIGSFLNVFIFRYNSGKTLSGRSHCFSCGRIISWYDLIPVISFIFLRARCRFCKSKISFEYPLVEAVTGILFFLVFLKLKKAFGFEHVLTVSGFLEIFYEFTVLSLLVVIFVYDLRHKIIPDLLAFIFGFLTFTHLFLPSFLFTAFQVPGILDLAAGPILALPIFLLWLVSAGRWIGLGDAKLALGIGWFLSLPLGISAVTLGFWIGAIVGLAGIAVSKMPRGTMLKKFLLSFGVENLIMVSEVPLAPFLITGLVVVFFTGWDIFGLTLILSL